MTESSTICIGSELFAVLSDLRARECDVWSLDTAVAGNAGYRVSFSEARGGIGRRSLVTGRVAPEDGFISTPACSNHAEPLISERVAALADRASNEVAKGVIPSCGEIPVALANLERRAPFVGNSPEVPGCETSGMAITATTTNENRGECDGKYPSHSMPTSLETRIKNLYEKAVKSGRVRTRFKSTIPSDEARKPYAD